jgi:hypothetical protein
MDVWQLCKVALAQFNLYTTQRGHLCIALEGPSETLGDYMGGYLENYSFQ